MKYLLLASNDNSDTDIKKVLEMASSQMSIIEVFDNEYEISQYFKRLNANTERREADECKKSKIFALMDLYFKVDMIDKAAAMFGQIKSELSNNQLIELVEFLNDKYGLNDKNIINAEDAYNKFEILCEDFCKRADEEKKLVKSIKTFIKKNYSKNINLETIAGEVYLHPSYLSRYFKRSAGMNFTEYILAVRIVNAIDLLNEDKYRINEIGTMVGYKNYKYFAKIFKGYTGFAPKEYLRENRGF